MTEERHFFEGCVKVGEELWFSASRENAICKKNLRTGEFCIADQFDTYHRAMHLHSCVFFDRGVLYFVPANANALAAYRIADRTCRYYGVQGLHVYGVKSGTPYYHFESAIQVGRRLYMISLLSPDITVFDLDKKTMELIYIRELDVQNRFYHHTFCKDACAWDRKLYLAVYGTSGILELDTDSGAYRILEYPAEAAFTCMAQEQAGFYMIDHTHAELVRYDARTGTFERLSHGLAGADTKGAFYKCLYRKQKLYLFQKYSDSFLIYDIGQGCDISVNAGVCPPEEAYLFCEERMESKYYAFWQAEDGIYFYYAPFDLIYRVDEKGRLFRVPFFDSQAKKALMMSRLSQVRHTRVYVEALPQDLELFMKNISHDCQHGAIADQTTVGERVYQESGKGAGK